VMPMTFAEHEDLVPLLALARSRGVGPVLCRRLLRRSGDPRRAYEALAALVGKGRLRGVRVCPLERAAEEVVRIRERGWRLLGLGGPGYPEGLAALDDAPPVLMVGGDLACFGRPMVAVVGARHASVAGCRFARTLAQDLSAAGVCVVSGLARGIDGAAHEGALAGAAGTVAVLAAGLDRVYPPEHRDLFARIRRRGVVMSEHPLGAPPLARHFPRRNRLIAALVRAVVVVEASERSGSLMTARLALDLGREVLAVPGSPTDPRHAGTNRLLREGAHLVERAEDVLALFSGPIAAAPPPAFQMPATGPAGGGDLTRRLLDALGPEPVPVDVLVRELGVEAAALQEALVGLEVEGLVLRHPGNRISRLDG